MSKAQLAGVPEDDAAVAFDCTPATMRQHDLAFGKMKIADRVFSQMRGNMVDAKGKEQTAYVGERSSKKRDAAAKGNGASSGNGNADACRARQSAQKKRTCVDLT
jgi:hypothetical protein